MPAVKTSIGEFLRVTPMGVELYRLRRTKAAQPDYPVFTICSNRFSGVNFGIRPSQRCNPALRKFVHFYLLGVRTALRSARLMRCFFSCLPTARAFAGMLVIAALSNPDFSRVLQTASVFVSSLLSSIECSFLNESLSLGRVQSTLSFCRIAQPASFVHRMQAAAIMRRAARIVMIRMSSFLSIWRIRCFRGLGGTLVY
jgi:hypothetical protein